MEKMLYVLGFNKEGNVYVKNTETGVVTLVDYYDLKQYVQSGMMDISGCTLLNGSVSSRRVHFDCDMYWYTDDIKILKLCLFTGIKIQEDGGRVYRIDLRDAKVSNLRLANYIKEIEDVFEIYGGDKELVLNLVGCNIVEDTVFLTEKCDNLGLIISDLGSCRILELFASLMDRVAFVDVGGDSFYNTLWLYLQSSWSEDPDIEFLNQVVDRFQDNLLALRKYFNTSDTLMDIRSTCLSNTWIDLYDVSDVDRMYFKLLAAIVNNLDIANKELQEFIGGMVNV